MKNTVQAYRIPGIDEYNKILDILKSDFTIIEQKDEEKFISIYDTFDWRLYHNNLNLFLSGETLTLREQHNKRPVITGSMKKHKKLIRIPEGGPIFSRIKPIIQPRALIQFIFLKKTCKKLIFKENSIKTNSVQIEFCEISPAGARSQSIKQNSFLFIKYPGGNRDSCNSINDKMKNFIKCKLIKKDFFTHILNTYNIKPGNYSSKFSVKLLPHMTTETACRIILSTLLHSIKQNENGIKKNIDTEFLHDFRVAVRRTRSLFAQVKKVFPKNLIKPFRDGFKYYAKLTNKPRDIDVYLLEIENFKTILPENIRSGLIPLYKYLKKKHNNLYNELKKELESTQYTTLIKDWDCFLSTPINPEDKPAKAETPVLKTANRIIRLQYQNVIASGVLIQEISPPDDLHSLRIECKKLRYLLEFFISLFPNKYIKKIISSMKKLQDNLGKYQDFQVQQQTLSRFLEELRTDPGFNPETEQAIQFLRQYFNKEEEKTRRDFFSLFTQFNSIEIKSFFLTLFGPESPSHQKEDNIAEPDR